MAASGSSGGGSGGGLSGASKVAIVIAGGTVAGLIGFFVVPDGDDGDDPPPTPAVTIVATATRPPEPDGSSSVVTVPPAATVVAKPSGIDRKALTDGYPEGALLTITVFGMPARVGATFEDEANSVYTRGMFVRDPGTACMPDQQYPDPCIYYWLVKPGTNVTVTAGDSRAGYWPAFEAVHGPGCELVGGDSGGQDVSCTLTLALDVEMVATYYGSERPGLAHYTYPVCPTQRGEQPPSWAARCP